VLDSIAVMTADGDTTAPTNPRRPLTLAVAQPTCVPCDVTANALVHADAVRAAGAQVVVFPELSLTGYELDTAPVVSPDSIDLLPLIDACAQNGTVALAGAPVRDGTGKTYIATMAVTGSGATVAYRKIWLGSDERRRFFAGERPEVYEVGGWRLGLAICKDTSISAHTRATGGLNLDVFVAGLVMGPDQAAEQDARGVRIAQHLGVAVAFASFAGPTGSGYSATAGRSTIWKPDGTVIAHAGSSPGEIALATLPAVSATTYSPG
jgi:predicted amidohydrolase